MEMFTGHLSSGSLFWENSCQKSDFILNSLPFLKQLIGSIENLVAPAQDFTLKKFNETGSKHFLYLKYINLNPFTEIFDVDDHTQTLILSKTEPNFLPLSL